MIYFIQNGHKKAPIKIGHTKNNIRNRMDLLQTGNPVKLKLLAVVDIDHRGVEGQIHKKFKEQRIIGEWFKCCPELLEFIKAFSKKAKNSQKTFRQLNSGCLL